VYSFSCSVAMLEQFILLGFLNNIWQSSSEPFILRCTCFTWNQERGKHRCIYYPREVASISENQLTHRDVARRRIGAQEESVPRKRTQPLEKSTCTTGNDLRSPAIYHTMPPHRPHTPPIWICWVACSFNFGCVVLQLALL